MENSIKASKGRIRIVSDGTDYNTKIYDENGDLIRAKSITIQGSVGELFSATINVIPEFDIEINNENVAYQFSGISVDKLHIEKDDVIVLKNTGSVHPVIAMKVTQFLKDAGFENKIINTHGIELGVIKKQ